MALFQTRPKIDETANESKNIAAKIQQRRYQILVHSLLYYELDMNLVSDAKWSEWAVELAELQKLYPEIADTVIFANAFRGFDGSTGFDLPYRDEQIVNIAGRLIRASDMDDKDEAIRRLRTVSSTPANYSGFKSTDTKPSQPKRKEVKKVEAPSRKKLF